MKDNSNVRHILTQLRCLYERSQKDLDNKNYNPYEYYLKEYNSLLNQLHFLELYLAVVPISEVPNGQKACSGVGTSAEIAKHCEIVNKIQALVRMIETDYPKLKEKIHKPFSIGDNWITAIAVLVSLISAAYFLGKDIGYSRFDKDKQYMENENKILKEENEKLIMQNDSLLRIKEDTISRLHNLSL